MQRPETWQELKALIKTMQHRERFVFDLRDDSSECKTGLEVYTTTDYAMGDRLQNVKYQVVGADGKYYPKIGWRRSIMFHVTVDEFFQHIHELIAIAD